MARSLNDIIEQRYPGLGAAQGNLTGFLTHIYYHERNHLVALPQLEIANNFDVQNVRAYSYMINGLLYNDAAAGVCDTGTTATFPATTWGAFLVSVDTSGNLTATWVTNSSAGYGTEALALAALPTVPVGELCIGYVSVQAHATGQFLAGTDALEGGSGGDPSQDTNYYNSDHPVTLFNDPDTEN
jgi:hypothetical protein